tara:strand:- start:36 stop:446 length:411 start_codon:yes stop_codon:yes gene_type:complete
MRRGNILDLKKKDVNLKPREVRFTLNKIPKPMVVPISNKLAQVFAQVPWSIEDEGLLFPGLVRKIVILKRLILKIDSSAAESILRPLINVTPLPFLPLVSRDTRTLPSPGGDVFLRQVHCLMGLPQPGQILPCSVE